MSFAESESAKIVWLHSSNLQLPFSSVVSNHVQGLYQADADLAEAHRRYAAGLDALGDACKVGIREVGLSWESVENACLDTLSTCSTSLSKCRGVEATGRTPPTLPTDPATVLGGCNQTGGFITCPVNLPLRAVYPPSGATNSISLNGLQGGTNYINTGIYPAGTFGGCPDSTRPCR